MATKQKYFTHPRYDGTEFIGVIINKKRINLMGKDVDQVIPASKKGPETKVTWKGAKQEDLAAYYALGNQKIVYVEDVVDEKSKAVATT